MAAPKIIGPYEIVELLGRGGMGEVYKAVDTRMYRRPVALKLLSEAMGADPRALNRFDQEIETAANLRHPNIVQIYDRGEHEGRRYFTMELLEGRDLADLIKERGQRSLDARLEIILQLCDALEYAHANGVVHRDIKPANILVITRGGTDHVKLVDFGIAHVARSDHTRTVVQPGTMLYMSPEQLKDEGVSPRSDLFSLGIVAYELCAGAHPFRAKTEYLTSSNIMFEKHVPLRSLEPAAPEALEALFDRLLEKDGESRPESAAEVTAQLKAIVRQLRAASSADTEAPSFGNLDEMTGPMVERIVHWAKGKEASGAIVEALEAYKRAILLAPNAPWLHARVARLEEQLARAPSLDVPAEDDPDQRTSSRNRHRETFVRERMVEADAALDEGELDQASSIAAVILRQYPDEAQALALMDRIVLITDRGVPVKSYRQALRAAREALAGGDVPSAQRSCETAVAIWPDDEEVITLGREIEKLRHVELAKALSACDDLLARAASGTLDDDAAPAAVASAHEALRRAEEMGAATTTLGAKREALDRLLSEARARTAERARKDREAEEARRAEVKHLLDDAALKLAAAERAASADSASAQAALASVPAARDAIARAEALGAGAAETAGLGARFDAATRVLEAHIAREAQRERELAARMDAIRSGLAEVDQLAAGDPDDALRAGELLRAVESDLAAVAADRPSAKELPGLGRTAAGLRERIAERRRAEDERRVREANERRESEEKERLAHAERERQEQSAREAKERQERAEREARERQQRQDKEKVAARAERLRALLVEARTAFKEADDLAASIATDADLMPAPLAIARRATESMLEIDPADTDAKALLPKIAKLAGAAGKHADEAARLRQEAADRRRDEEAMRRAAGRAAWTKRLMIGGAAIVVLGVAVGGWFAYTGWRQRENARIEAERRAGIEREHAEAVRLLENATTGIESVRSAIPTIKTQDAKDEALRRCGELDLTLRKATGLDASNPALTQAKADLSSVRTDIENVGIGAAPVPRDEDLETRLLAIRSDLDFAARAPAGPVERIDEALGRANQGIRAATDLLKDKPSERQTQSLLTELQNTKSALLQRRKNVVDKPGERQLADRRERSRRDLASAQGTLAKVESQLRAGKINDPEAAIAESRQAKSLVDRVLVDDPGQSEATRLAGRIDDAIARIGKAKPPAPTPAPPPSPQPVNTLRQDVDAHLEDAKRQSLSSPAGVAARISLDRQGLEKVARAGGQDWAPAKGAELQSDLDRSLVFSLFHKFRDALVARDTDAIAKLYPSYPSAKAIAELRGFEYSFDIVDLDVAAKTAAVRETTRVHHKPDFWAPATTATRKYVLDRRADGSWFIVSASLAR